MYIDDAYKIYSKIKSHVGDQRIIDFTSFANATSRSPAYPKINKIRIKSSYPFPMSIVSSIIIFGRG